MQRSDLTDGHLEGAPGSSAFAGRSGGTMSRATSTRHFVHRIACVGVFILQQRQQQRHLQYETPNSGDAALGRFRAAPEIATAASPAAPSRTPPFTPKWHRWLLLLWCWWWLIICAEPVGSADGMKRHCGARGWPHVLTRASCRATDTADSDVAEALKAPGVAAELHEPSERSEFTKAGNPFGNERVKNEASPADVRLATSPLSAAVNGGLVPALVDPPRPPKRICVTWMNAFGIAKRTDTEVAD
ncbi:unnamed protein product [Lampetra planeri]